MFPVYHPVGSPRQVSIGVVEGCKNASREMHMTFSPSIMCALFLLKSHLPKKVTWLGQGHSGRALQASMVRALIQGGEKNSAHGCNPSTTAFTGNRVTLQFILKLIQATSLHTANICPSLLSERQEVLGKQRHLEGGRATKCLLSVL